MGGTDRAHVRLAELLAALSLGIDLGFAQPMEHIQRQCLIALRLAERSGLDEQARATVYYTALLINVGCHTDAHEQAKWFGDDIALKSDKYDHELGSLWAAASGLRLLGSGSPALSRFRIGIEFALSGHRDLDGMITHHAAMARALAEQLGLPEDVQAALAGAYEQWDGRPERCRAPPCRCRRASRSWRSSARSPTASAASRRRRSSPAPAPAASSTRRWPR
ncbi:MAG: hypothetical protein ACXVFL_10095 [Solirubrobacteraceae bacterium]